MGRFIINADDHDLVGRGSQGMHAQKPKLRIEDRVVECFQPRNMGKRGRHQQNRPQKNPAHNASAMINLRLARGRLPREFGRDAVVATS